MSFEQLKHEVALLDERQQAELISYTLQLRYAHDTPTTVKSPTGSMTRTNPTG